MNIGVHPSTVYRRFKKEKGLSLKAIFTQERLKIAKGMLKRGYNIQAIAQELGFCDRYYFSKWFKRLTGLSPSQYRNSPNPSLTSKEKDIILRKR